MCLSGTLVIHDETVHYFELSCASHDRAMFLVFEAKFCSPEFRDSFEWTSYVEALPVKSDDFTNTTR